MSIKKALKSFLLNTFPAPAGALQAARQRRHIRRFERRLGLPELTRAYTARLGFRVASGPFAGMAYVPSAVGSAFIPKLLGSYEAELHEAIAEIIGTEYTTIVDIGCAEGYYAVGLALRLPGAQVHAFDTDQRARELCAAMASANGVGERVTVGGKCDPARLNALLSAKTFIVCDCEGYEVELLRPDLVPGLKGAGVLVELHDVAGASATETILERFRPTHHVQLITSVPRSPDHYPALTFLPPDRQHLAVSEFRSDDQQWAYLTPKISNAT